MKQWLIKWSTSIHAGAAIVTGDTISQAQIAFMENTDMSDIEYPISSSNINSIEELPVSDVPTIIAEIWK